MQSVPRYILGGAQQWHQRIFYYINHKEHSSGMRYILLMNRFQRMCPYVRWWQAIHRSHRLPAGYSHDKFYRVVAGQ